MLHRPSRTSTDGENVLGCASLAVWALIVVISIKYCLFILRADNEGEGGTVALLGKIPPTKQRGGSAKRDLSRLP